MAFNNRLQGLLAGGNPMFDLGVGLLAAGAPTARPQSFGGNLGQAAQFASQRQQDALRNDLIRQEMQQRARQQSALRQLPGLLSETSVVQGPSRQATGIGGEQLGTIPGRQGLLPAIQTPEGQQRMLGLLSQAAPAQTAQTLLGQILPQQERAEPSFVRELRAAGLDPASGEGQQILLDRLRNQNAPDEILRNLQAQMTAFQLDSLRRERLEEERTEAQERRGLENTINRNLSQVEKLADLNRDLVGTFMEAGLPAPDIRRMSSSIFNAALEGIGMDRSEQRQSVAKFDTFRKGLNDLIIQTIDRFGNNITNQQLSLLQDASANVNISPEAIASILADIAEINLQNADMLEGFSIEDREAMEQLIERERNFDRGSLTGSRSGAVDLGDGVTLEFIE